MDKVLFSSKSDDWATPQALFDKLDAVFHFTLDVCASDTNAKCRRYFTKEQNGLMRNWGGNTVWCNPPYGREIGEWVRRCCQHSQCSVMLLPVRTDTRWFHAWIYGNRDARVFFIRGRLKFGSSKNSAPFPSMVVVFRGHKAPDFVEDEFML